MLGRTALVAMRVLFLSWQFLQHTYGMTCGGQGCDYEKQNSVSLLV